MAIIDEGIKCLVNCINEANSDSLKMRNISNFYDRYVSERYGSDDRILEKLDLYSKDIENARDLKMFKILAFLLSNRDMSLLPETVEPAVDYRIGKMPLDSDLALCNIFVYEKEFE